MNDGAGLVLSVLLGMTAVALYFLPTVIASMRHKRNIAPIFIINLAFGWTLIGWVLTLAWAFATDTVSASTH